MTNSSPDSTPRAMAMKLAGKLGYVVGMAIIIPVRFYRMSCLFVRAGWLHVRLYHTVSRIHRHIPDWWHREVMERRQAEEERARIATAAELFGKN